jgi:hypothetical protein
MKEAKNMLWMLLGCVLGFGLGIYLFFKIFEWTGGHIGDNGLLSLALAVPTLGGGLVGGGLLTQWILYRGERRKRARRKAEKENAAPRKKRKK